MTAIVMAALRAYHQCSPPPRIFDDQFARALLTSDECESFERTAARLINRFDPDFAAACSDPHARIQRLVKGGGVGALVRASFMERSLAASMARGIRQYVIIGAGLDTFAFREPDIARQLQIIELDHPSMQKVKLERLERAGLTPPSNLHFSPVDLECDSLAEALGRAPYDRSAPAFISLPGVTMYLTKTAILKTLRSLAEYMVEGSELGFDYVEPEAFAPEAAARVRFALQRARGLGEPMLSGFDPRELHTVLGTFALALREDLGPVEIHATFLGQMDGFEAVEYYHLARAELDFSTGALT
jgi:methyltransferase (TIGR00027 family)